MSVYQVGCVEQSLALLYPHRFLQNSTFSFERVFLLFVFVIMFAAEIQLYFLVEPGRRTQKVETDVQLMIDGKLNEMQVSLIA